MAELILMPKMTLTMQEGFIGEWYIKEGDAIKIDDPLCSIENEKETEDLMSLYEGTILKIVAADGESYPVKFPIAVVGAQGDEYDSLLEKAKSAITEEEEQRPQVAVTAAPARNVIGDQYRIMPKVRKVIEEKGIDIEELAAFCDGRRITEAEIAAFERQKKA